MVKRNDGAPDIDDVDADKGQSQSVRALLSIRELILAGGFARHVDIDNAVTLGLFPDLPRDRFTILGNASLAGAYAALIDRQAMPAMQALHKDPEVIELNLIPAFEGNFIDGLYLPRPVRVSA